MKKHSKKKQKGKGFVRRLYVKPIDQQQCSHVPSAVGTATSELDLIATKDAAQWVQIYGLLRPTDANE